MHCTIIRFSRQEPVYWLGLGASVVGMFFLFVPLEAMVQAGVWISPVGTLQDKTILLFEALKVVLPMLGIAGVTWILIPSHARHVIISNLGMVIHSNYIVPSIIILALLLRLGWIVYYPTQLYAESQWYFDKAFDIANGQGYLYDLVSRKPTAAWPIGYPMFLALLFRLFGPSILIAKLANAALGVLIVYMTYLLAQYIFDHTVAVLSALWIAILPGIIVYSSLVCSDILFMALVMCVLLLMLKEETKAPLGNKQTTLLALVTGLINGLMILTRSTGLALLPLWIGIRWLNFRRRYGSSWQWVLAIVFGTCLVVLPWTLRNYFYFHKLVPVSTNGGVNFWMGNNSLAYGGYVFPRNMEQNPLLSLIGNEIALDETGYKLGLEFIRENPERALRLLPAKVFYLYNSNDAGLEWNIRSAAFHNQHGTGIRAYVLTNLVYTVLILFALFGLLILLFSSKRYRPLIWIGVIFGGYWTLVHLPFFGLDRFSLPVLPILTMYAAFGLAKLIGLDNLGFYPKRS